MRKFLLIGLLLLCALRIYADQNPNSNPNSNTVSLSFHRDYSLVLGAPYDLSNSVVNSRTAGKALIDAYYRGIGPKISNPIVRNVFGTLWSFTTT